MLVTDVDEVVVSKENIGSTYAMSGADGRAVPGARGHALLRL